MRLVTYTASGAKVARCGVNRSLRRLAALGAVECESWVRVYKRPLQTLANGNWRYADSGAYAHLLTAGLPVYP